MNIISLFFFFFDNQSLLSHLVSVSLSPLSLNRIATFDEITTQNFVDEYNKQGIYFDTDDDNNADVRCSLFVADVIFFFLLISRTSLIDLIPLLNYFFQGLLLYPKNDTENSNLMTLHEGRGYYGCYLVGLRGYAHFETWPAT